MRGKKKKATERKKEATERMRGKNNNNKGMEEREIIDKISS